MAAIVEAIGVISGVLGILQFGIDNFPKEDSVDSTVRVTVGLDTAGGLNNAGGDAPDVRLFNEAGEFIGMKIGPGKIEDGGFKDIKIEHDGDSTQQPTYALFSANKDAICVAYVSITLPNSDHYSWVGDWGHQCGGSWYYSHVYIGSTNVMPDCFWIDGNDDQPQSGFQVHWPEFFNPQGNDLPSDPQEQADKVNYFCNQGPPFKMYNYEDTHDPRGITFWTINDKRSEDGLEERGTAVAYGPAKEAVSAKFRRGAPSYYPRSNGTDPSTKKNPHANRLVMSNKAQHTAHGLCESKTSYGPDFVNVADGTFCRMSDKTQWPVCDGKKVVDNCFNKDTKKLIVNGVSARDTPYSNVLDWTD